MTAAPAQRAHAGRRRRRWLVATTFGVLVAAAVGASLALARGSGSHEPPPAGESLDRAVPALPLESESGRRTSLAAFRGRVVVMAPFLTLCHEVCPLTTGAFQTMQHAVERAGLSEKVVFTEVSVDPWRDSPARLRAFARLTRTRFPLLTGTASELARFWRFFGVAYWRGKEGKSPDTDWSTGKALSFDVGHTDGFFLIDARGHERVVDIGMPAVGPRLPHALRMLLSSEGRSDLVHPQPGWTVDQALDDLEGLLGRRIPRV